MDARLGLRMGICRDEGGGNARQKGTTEDPFH
jgi:hypothetical protein